MDFSLVLLIAMGVGLFSLALGVFVGWLTWKPTLLPSSGKAQVTIPAGTKLIGTDDGQICVTTAAGIIKQGEEFSEPIPVFPGKVGHVQVGRG